MQTASQRRKLTDSPFLGLGFCDVRVGMVFAGNFSVFALRADATGMVGGGYETSASPRKSDLGLWQIDLVAARNGGVACETAGTAGKATWWFGSSTERGCKTTGRGLKTAGGRFKTTERLCKTAPAVFKTTRRAVKVTERAAKATGCLVETTETGGKTTGHGLKVILFRRSGVLGARSSLS